LKPIDWKRAQFPPGEKHKNKCWMCGCHLTFEIATVDHLKPKSLGGLNRASNFRLACIRCNSARGNQPLTKPQRRALYGRTTA
jgi:5-methylcytosine-specific restriction endonuclease McrA